MIEMSLTHDEVCLDRLNAETRIVERKAEEFKRFFTTNQRSTGGLGFGSSLLDYLKETENSRKVQNIELSIHWRSAGYKEIKM